jgi:hypothetical protein
MAFFTRRTILLTDEITAVSGWLFGGVWWWGSFLGVRIINCVGEEMPRLWRKALVALVFEGVATEIELTLLAKGSESSFTKCFLCPLPRFGASDRILPSLIVLQKFC